MEDNSERNMARRIRQGEAGLLLVASLFFTITDPYGATETLPRAWAFFYWLATLMIGAGVGEATYRLTRRVGPTAPSFLPVIIAVLVASAAVLLTILIVQAGLGAQVPASFLATLYIYVVLILSVMAGVAFLLYSHFVGPDRAAHKALSDPVNTKMDLAQTDLDGFRARLPNKFKSADIHALHSEDHYLQVLTDKGDALIRMRLADAIALLVSLDGRQVHRSWWVARQAVQDVVRESRGLSLRLSEGRRVPVSRSKRADVERWLAEGRSAP